jgi:MYXO-CTERM domain-containing protein
MVRQTQALPEEYKMSSRFVVLGSSIALAMPILLWVAPSRADVPAGYKGTPYMGTPWPIPGRIEFENYDDGGENVGWRVDDSTGNFGQGGCAGNDLRMGVHPQICRSNTSVGEVDLYSMGPQMGKHYPSDAMPQSYYIGYTHPSDWVKVTVNVATAGTYKVSSVWASDPGGAGGIKFQMLFNDTMKADVSLTGTGGYHNWVEFPDFATVQLDAGVQVFQFAPKSFHLNYDYVQFSLVTADGGVDPGNSDGGSMAGAGGGGAGSAGAAGAGGNVDPTGSGGTMGSGGAMGAAGSAGSGTSGDPGTAGSTGGSGTSGGSTATSSDVAGPSTSGCACTLGGGERRGDAALAMMMAGIATLGRRRRRFST